MTFKTKYNIGDIVWFVFSHKSGVGKIDIHSGEVKTIFIQQSDEKIIITYNVSQYESFHEEVTKIEEQFLFSNKKEIFKFFVANIREFFGNPPDIRPKEIEDDLPF